MRLVGIVAGIWLAASPELGTAAPSEAGEQVDAVDQQAILTLVVNDVLHGEVTVTLRGNDVLVTAGDLEGAGLKLAGGRGVADPQGLVSLVSLAPDIQFVLDVDQLTLKVTAAPRFLGEAVIDLRTRGPEQVIDTKTSSAWLNYAVSSESGQTLTAVGEAGASVGGSLVRTNVTRMPTGKVVRNDTSWTIDWPALLLRSVVGDGYADAGGLGGGAFIGGIGISRNYDLDPYAMRHPAFGLEGATSTPSELDVYVNGALVHREQIAPGTFQVRNLPLVTGSGDTRLVIKNNFGHEQVIDTRYYFSAGLLGKGVSDFAFHMGARRLDVGSSSWAYGSPVMVGRYRRGLTDTLTAGSHVEAAWDLVSGGASVATTLPIGELEAEAAASRSGSSNGTAAMARYVFASARGNTGFGGQYLGDRFATLARAAADDRPTLQLQAFAGTRVSRVGVNVQLSQEHTRDVEGWNQRLQLGVTSPIGKKLTASITAAVSQSRTNGVTGEVYALFSAPLGARTSATLALDHAHGNQATLGVQRSLPIGTGFGYQLQGSGGTDTPNMLDGAVQAQGRYGRYEVRGAVGESTQTWSASAAGGLVAIGGSVFATQPVQDGFALVRVPGVKGVHVKLNNVEIGKTNSHGDLLIPTLLPYFGNHVAIRDSDVPINRALGTTDIDLTVPYRGGAIAVFRADPLHSASGSLAVIERGGERSAPRFGTLTVAVPGAPATSPIGYEGEFFIDQIVAGRYPATIEYTGGTCHFELVVPAGDAPIAELGALVCNATAKGSP